MLEKEINVNFPNILSCKCGNLASKRRNVVTSKRTDETFPRKKKKRLSFGRKIFNFFFIQTQSGVGVNAREIIPDIREILINLNKLSSMTRPGKFIFMAHSCRELSVCKHFFRCRFLVLHFVRILWLTVNFTEL